MIRYPVFLKPVIEDVIAGGFQVAGGGMRTDIYKKSVVVITGIPVHTLTFRTDCIAIPIRNEIPAMPRLMAAISRKRR